MMPTKEEITKADKKYRKMRDAQTKDYIEVRTKDAIYRAPDTPAGRASLKKREKS